VAALLALGTVAAQPAFAALPSGSHEQPTPVDDTAVPAVDPSAATGPGVYIVSLRWAPAAAYDGGVDGYPATRPHGGDRFDRTREAVTSYTSLLRERQDRVLADAGHPEVLYRLTTALDGFVVRLTGQQVKRLRADDRVTLVERSTRQHVAAAGSPHLLGDPWAGGVRAGHGGPDGGGRGTVVGVVDTGIWPENPSFAGVPLPTPGTSRRVPGFHGACQDGEQWDDSDCNNKVLSARYFLAAFGRDGLARSEYASPRDATGHGTHVAATAAGNHDVAVSVEGQDFGLVSGVAPAARVAVYKACWTAPNPEDDGCETADAVAAIDRAVADGVDVLNYSVSGNGDTITDSVQQAFLNAAAAGVFVAASAGNTGPAAGTVQHAAPWVTTVAAGTQRLFQGAVVLGDGTSYVGDMVSDRSVGPTRIVLAENAAAPGATEDEARLCQVGALDATVVEDRIVVCDRGITPRVEKSEAVARAGGAGMVLANVTPDSTDADFHAVPTVHVDVQDATAIKDYVREHGADATASLDPSGSEEVPVPQIAAFSARGPVAATGGDLLKPDLTAPGVSVLAAAAPPAHFDRLWDLYSGTSVSAAHVAGLAALAAQAHPDWSPAATKSALMTSADDLAEGADPLAEGAGQADAGGFLDPGLVYDTNASHWRDVAAGVTPAEDLNLPSIAVGDLYGTRTVTRRVTNVSSHTESFTATVEGLDGIEVKVSPSSLTLAPGESRRFRVRFRTTAAAPVGGNAQGWLTWTGLTHEVRSPVVVHPALLAAPAEVSGTGRTGSLRVRGVAGTSAPVPVSTTGLVPSAPIGVTLEPGRFDPAHPSSDLDTFETRVTVPSGTRVLRFDMQGRPGDDMDLYVYRDGLLVAQSARGDADETVTMLHPVAGDYTLFISSVRADNGSTTTGQLYSWVVGDEDAGNLELGTDTITGAAGEQYRYDVSWSSLDLTRRWLGVVEYGGDPGITTLVSVG
jgi:hypothetical protein